MCNDRHLHTVYKYQKRSIVKVKPKAKVFDPQHISGNPAQNYGSTHASPLCWSKPETYGSVTIIL